MKISALIVAAALLASTSVTTNAQNAVGNPMAAIGGPNAQYANAEAAHIAARAEYDQLNDVQKAELFTLCEGVARGVAGNVRTTAVEYCDAIGDLHRGRIPAAAR